MSGGGKTILLIDDSELLLEVARYRLEQCGFTVAIATDLETLRAAIAENRPDLIVRDVEMPDVPTAELARVLLETGAPVWLFSALDEPILAERASAEGIDGYISKNAGMDALIERARSLLAD